MYIFFMKLVFLFICDLSYQNLEAYVFDTGITFLINILDAKGDSLKDCFVSGLSLKAVAFGFILQ